MLSDTSIVVCALGPLAATVDDEIVMLSPEQGAYFGLNAVGSRVWELIAAPRPVAEVCATLTAEYEVDDDTCAADVRDFLQELAAAGLVEVRQ
jgi:hypothetical protein